MHAVMETEANIRIGQYASRLRCINHNIKLNKLLITNIHDKYSYR